MQLPPPMVEQSPALPASGEQRGNTPEQYLAGAEQAPAPNPGMPSPTPVVPALAVPAPTVPLPQAPSSSTSTATLAASDDADLIEKEWVDKAKAIVERTRDDPYKQSEELTLVKADYLKKRYNKTIKLNK